MNFEEKLDNHRSLVKEKIPGGGLLATIAPEENCNKTIDYYGAENLIKTVNKSENSAEFATLLFLDALTSSIYFSATKKDYSEIIKRDVLVLNTSNVFDSQFNLSHKFPQMLLGLKKTWKKEDNETFESLFNEYVYYYSNKHKEIFNDNFFKTLLHDQNLNDSNLEYPSFGLKINTTLMKKFHKLRIEIAEEYIMRIIQMEEGLGKTVTVKRIR